MSAAVTLNAEQLGMLAAALKHLTNMRANTRVLVDSYGPVSLSIDGQVLEASWDAETEQYVIRDQVGR